MKANCLTNVRHPMGVVREKKKKKRVSFIFFSNISLWRLLPSWDYNNSCAPFKKHTYKVAGSRPRTTRLKRVLGSYCKACFWRFLFFFSSSSVYSARAKRYLFHLALSPLRDGLLWFHLIPTRTRPICWNARQKLRRFIKNLSLRAGISIKSEAFLLRAAEKQNKTHARL